MSIFVDENTKVIVQGLTGGQGKFHGLRNRDYGTKIVGGVTPGKGGTDVDGIPVFNTVKEAVEATGATASFVSVPPKFAAGAIIEAAEGGIKFIVCITEGIPAHDEAVVFNRLVEEFPGVRLLGPNCPGIISPGKCNIGITSGDIAGPSASCRVRGPSPTRHCTNSASRASARPPAWASGATPFPEPTSLTASPPSRRTPRPRPS
jgi:succinyl-CoA synthetase alpha subunit